jgi:hypothetical protein
MPSLPGRLHPVSKLFFCIAASFLSCRASAQQTSSPPPLSPAEGTQLAERMCRQLPNVSSIPAIVSYQPAKGAPSPPASAEDFPVYDDAYETLLALGPYSLPCLTARMLDTRWMPDPRSEPLLGHPRVGDVAYIILMDKGVADLLPALMHKPDPRMDEYFLWPSVGQHRRQLQQAVRDWISKHPGCCGHPPTLRKSFVLQPSFQMSPADLAKASAKFATLRPGMSPDEVLKIAGQPDAIDPGEKQLEKHFQASLLGFSALDHNENLAYIYFTQRWTSSVARRNLLCDRYVIVFFSAQGQLTRMFSNVPEILPVFPSNAALWQRLMWGDAVDQK